MRDTGFGVRRRGCGLLPNRRFGLLHEVDLARGSCINVVVACEFLFPSMPSVEVELVHGNLAQTGSVRV